MKNLFVDVAYEIFRTGKHNMVGAELKISAKPFHKIHQVGEYTFSILNSMEG